MVLVQKLLLISDENCQVGSLEMENKMWSSDRRLFLQKQQSLATHSIVYHTDDGCWVRRLEWDVVARDTARKNSRPIKRVCRYWSGTIICRKLTEECSGQYIPDGGMKGPCIDTWACPTCPAPRCLTWWYCRTYHAQNSSDANVAHVRLLPGLQGLHLASCITETALPIPYSLAMTTKH